MKKKIKILAREILILIVIILFLNFLIEGLKKIHLEKTESIGTVARVSNMVMKEEAQPLPVVPTIGEDVYSLSGEFTGYAVNDGYTPGIVMASTKEVYVGSIACPIKYKFGTKIEIEKLGIFICEDRMAKRFRDKEKFDIFFNNIKKAKEFGIKKLNYRTIK